MTIAAGSNGRRPNSSERIVGALFADVVGSTALGERLDPEAVAERVGDVVATVVLAVEANGGVVKDIAGDGVLALFDLPADTGRAAVAVIEGVRALREATAPDDALDVRVGAALGSVRAVEVRSSPAPGAPAAMRVVGPAITAAVNLEGRAAPGTALVSDAILALTAGAVSTPSERAPRSSALHGAAAVVPAAELPSRSERRQAASDRAIREERRAVVAMFAAITSEGAGSDDDVAVALRAGIGIVERFGGIVKDLAGDVVVALFGAPLAHEDDTERAVLAGLAMCGELPRVSGGRIDVRVGVASGRVVVGSVGAGTRVEYGAIGDAMNTAARLEASCPIGEVLVTETVAHEIEDRFEWPGRHAIEAKGKREPVMARTARLRARTTFVTGSHERPFFGRGQELARLVEAVVRGGVAAIVGEPGIGKSALVQAAAAKVASARWIVVRCPSWQSNRHLGAATSVLEELTDRVVDATNATSPEKLETTLGAELSSALAALARDGRAVVVVEDGQWMDAASVRVLVDAVAAQPDMALLLTLRPQGLPALVDHIEELIELGRLEEPDDGALLEQVVGRAVLPWDVERRVLATSAGNPFFLLAQITALEESGCLIRDDNGSRFMSGATPVVLETVERLLLGRFDQLAAAPRAAVDALAVLRSPSTAEVVAAVCEVGVDKVGATLDSLCAIGLASADGGNFELAGSLARDVAYGAILLRDRIRLHRLAAEAIGDRDAAAASWHWWEAGLPSAATRLAVIAGNAARARLSYGEAADAFSLAARAAQLAGVSAQRCGVMWLDAGHAHLAAASLDAAMDALAAASILAIEAGDEHTAAVAAVGYEDALFETRRPRGAAGERGRQLLRAAKETAPALDPSTRGRLLAALGRERRFAGDPGEAESLTDEAVEWARQSADPATLAYALTAWRVAREAPEKLHARSSTDAELVDAAIAAGDQKLEFEARRLVLMDQLASGQLSDAWAQVDDLTRLADTLAERRLAWLAPMWRVMRPLACGPLAAAVDALGAVYLEGRRAAYSDVVAVHALQEFLVRRHQCRVVEVRATFDRAERFAGSRWSVFRASLEAELGQWDAARSALDRVMAEPALLGGDRVLPTSIAFLADAATMLGDSAVAARLYAWLAPWSGQLVVVGTGAAVLGPVDHTLGRLAATAGDEASALRHLRSALATARRAGAQIAVAECAASLANAVEGTERARLSDEARIIGETVGSSRLVALADETRVTTTEEKR